MTIHEQLFADACGPVDGSELALHSRKLSELRTWVKEAVSEHTNKVLLITGPTGVGKSTSIKVVCGELNVQVINYEQEILYEENGYLEEDLGIEDLCKFIRQCGANISGARSKSILLIEHLPESIFRMVEKFRRLLLSALYVCRRSVILCLSDVESCWHLNPRRIFPLPFCKDVGIEVLHFNPVSKTLMKKAIVQAARKLDLRLKPKSIESLIDSSNGDVRVAVNMLQFNSNSQVTIPTGCNREEVFHMLGRILYAKRIETNVKRNERPPLERNVNDIIEMSSMPHEKVIDFLFEHEPKFASTLTTLRKVFEVLSLCDSIDSSWEVRRRLPDEYTSQIAARSIMYHNYLNERKSGLILLHKPVVHDLKKQVDRLQEECYREPHASGQFFAITAPFINRLEIPDHTTLTSYVTRPFGFSWKSGREAWAKVPQKRIKKPKLKKQNAQEKTQPDDVFTIEDSDDGNSSDSSF